MISIGWVGIESDMDSMNKQKEYSICHPIVPYPVVHY